MAVGDDQLAFIMMERGVMPEKSEDTPSMVLHLYLCVDLLQTPECMCCDSVNHKPFYPNIFIM